MAYVLGIDGGATKTFALAASTDGEIVGFGQAGPGNHEEVGVDVAASSLVQAALAALGQAGLWTIDAIQSCYSLAGADFYPDDFEVLAEALTRHGAPAPLSVKNDMFGCLRGGTHRPYGVVINEGTAFNAAGIGLDGSEVRFPSQDRLSGHWGGGKCIAQEILFHVFRAWDGRGPSTMLTDLVLRHTGSATVDDLQRILFFRRQTPRELVNSLCPLAFAAANAGDEIARKILIEFAEEAGGTANTIIRRLRCSDVDVEVVLAGSVFKGEGKLFIDTMKHVVHTEHPKAVLVTPRYEPVVGATLLALEAAGVQISGSVEARLDASVPSSLRRDR